MLCILHKWLISRSMNVDGPLSRRVIKHIDGCPACKSFHDHCLALADELPNEANRQRPKVSTELHRKIMGRCYEPVRKTETSVRVETNIRRSRWTLAPAIAAGVILVTILAIQLYPGSEPSPQKPGPGVQVAVGDTGPIDWLLDAGLKAGTAASIEGFLQGPIQEEIGLLKQDGKAAAEFILACVPLDVDGLVKNDTP